MKTEELVVEEKIRKTDSRPLIEKLSRLTHAVIACSGLGVEELKEVSDARCGYPGFTYYSDTGLFYEHYEALIWASLAKDSEELGMSIIELLGDFGIQESVYDEDDFKNMLAWYSLEQAAEECRELDM